VIELFRINDEFNPKIRIPTRHRSNPISDQISKFDHSPLFFDASIFSEIPKCHHIIFNPIIPDLYASSNLSLLYHVRSPVMTDIDPSRYPLGFTRNRTQAYSRERSQIHRDVPVGPDAAMLSPPDSHPNADTFAKSFVGKGTACVVITHPISFSLAQ
jgi:hypothetical protein